MHSAIDLRQHILREIVDPMLTEQFIETKAEELKLGVPLDRERAGKLYNSIFNTIISNITEFMESAEARQLCGRVQLYDPKASFASDIRKPLKEKIERIFHVDFSQELDPQPLSSSQWDLSWVWHVLGY